MSDEVKKAHDELHAFMFENVYRNPVASQRSQKAKLLVEKLYMYYLKNCDKLPEEYKKL